MGRQDSMRPEILEEETNNDSDLLLLFDRLVREHGTVRAGELLGVSYRTVAKVRDTRQLTPHVTNALEVFRLSDTNPAIKRIAARVSVLEARLEEIDGRLTALSKAVEQSQQKTAAFLESLLKMARATERKTEKLETLVRRLPSSVQHAGDGTQVAPPKSGTAKKPPRPTTWFPRRTYPQLVTREPAEDDEHVYQDAWPVVHEWRELTKVTHFKGKTLTWMKRRERVLELEVRLLDEFQLTLPPEKHPINNEWRRKLLRWHDDDLRAIRGRIVRRLMLRWVRRVLTLGQWWE